MSDLALNCGARPQVIQDLHEECGKHGAITRVFVPRPPNPSFLAASVFGTSNYGKVRVFFVPLPIEATCSSMTPDFLVPVQC